MKPWLQHLLIGLGATAGFALAATAPFNDSRQLVREQPRILVGIQALDLNGDGHASRREAAIDRDLLQHFDTLDTDHDDQLSPTEYLQFQRS